MRPSGDANFTSQPCPATTPGSPQRAGIEELSGGSGPLPPGRVAIVASRYHVEACDAMVDAAVQTLQTAGLTSNQSILLTRVPGAWELPLGVQLAMRQPGIIGAIAIGVVIRGETTHDEHINRAVSLQLMRLTASASMPVALGLLTCNTAEQVAARTGGALGNKGAEAAEAVIEMLRLAAQLN